MAIIAVGLVFLSVLTNAINNAQIGNKAANVNDSILQIFVNCGTSKTKIGERILTKDVDSELTIPGEMPWMVEIFQQKMKRKKFKGAGSLIHPKVVLTARHCVASAKAKQLTVVANGREVFQNVGTNSTDERNVTVLIKHPDYNSGTLQNDIALLILDEEFNYWDSYLNSICVASPGVHFVGEDCVVAGWGEDPNRNTLLKKVEVPIVSFYECQSILQNTNLGNTFQLHGSQMCAGGEEGRDSCKGDGGAPLMCLVDNNRYVQVGIVSWGVYDQCGVAKLPSVYTNVTLLRDWIEIEMKKHNTYL